MDADSANSSELEAVRQQFEHWRANRKNSRSRIPDELWQAAKDLSATYSINKVPKTLRFLKPKTVKQTAIDQTPFESTVAEIRPLTFTQVRRTEHEKICDSLIDQYHYLGYTRPVGEHLKYVVFSRNRPIACLIWTSAPYHIGCRDA